MRALTVCPRRGSFCGDCPDRTCEANRGRASVPDRDRAGLTLAGVEAALEGRLHLPPGELAGGGRPGELCLDDRAREEAARDHLAEVEGRAVERLVPRPGERRADELRL